MNTLIQFSKLKGKNKIKNQLKWPWKNPPFFQLWLRRVSSPPLNETENVKMCEHFILILLENNYSLFFHLVTCVFKL